MKFKKIIKDPIVYLPWVLPTLLIPPLRFLGDSDKPKKLRKELFFRDFGAYAMGSGIFAGAAWAVAKKLEKINIPDFKKNVISVAAATTAFCVWSGAVAPRLSKYLTGINRKKSPYCGVKSDGNPEKISSLDIKLNIKEESITFRATKALNTYKYPHNSHVLSQFKYSGYDNLKI